MTENPNNLLSDGGIVAMDGNVVMNNMPWLVDSGGLQLKSLMELLLTQLFMEEEMLISKDGMVQRFQYLEMGRLD